MAQKRIEICGCIASGKTTLAKVLSGNGFQAVYERYWENPFLNDFYQKKEKDNAFEVEMVFTLMHYNLIKQNDGEEKLVTDYSLIQDLCYGIQNLSDADFPVYRSLYEHLNEALPPLHMVICLKCSTECLLKRIAERNRDMEQTISAEYLQENMKVMERQLKGKENVLTIDSERYDFEGRDRERIVKMVSNFYGSRISG